MRRKATGSLSSLKSSGAGAARRNSLTCACRTVGNLMNKRQHLAPLSLLVAFLLMTAFAASVQVKTAKPGEQVERHLSDDRKFKEWELDPNVVDDIRRIKVCRV